MIILLKVVFVVLSVIIILLTLVATIGGYYRERKMQHEIDTLFNRVSSTDNSIISEERLSQIPHTIQQYLIRAQVLNKPQKGVISLHQEGMLRTSAKAPWAPFDAWTYVLTHQPVYICKTIFKRFPLIPLTVWTQLVDGKGSSQKYLMASVGVNEKKSLVTDREAMIRYLGEMVWFPPSFLNPDLIWEEIDQYTFKVGLYCHDQQVNGIYHFDERGYISRFTAQQLYKDNGSEIWKRCHHTYSSYHLVGKFRIPTRSKRAWELNNETFTFADIHIKDAFFHDQ